MHFLSAIPTYIPFVEHNFHATFCITYGTTCMYFRRCTTMCPSREGHVRKSLLDSPSTRPSVRNLGCVRYLRVQTFKPGNGDETGDETGDSGPPPYHSEWLVYERKTQVQTRTSLDLFYLQLYMCYYRSHRSLNSDGQVRIWNTECLVEHG
jgi:hypothetical protein